MAKMQVSCPNCRQPLIADVQQLFDVNLDPTAKQRLLSGAANFIQCKVCGYSGALSTVIVYHDPDKELLLTFVPPEIGVVRGEQERLIGGLINQAISGLPQEKRKGYLFNPQSVLTMQGLVERVLEADGITREMLQAQQQKLDLLQRLAVISDQEVFLEAVQQSDNLIDAEFFMLLNRLGEVAMSGGDRESAQKLVDLQRKLLPVTTYGKQVKAQSDEIQKAMQDLQSEGGGLTRERLLEMLLESDNETRVNALASLARPALDYAFFQMLSERIEKANPDQKAVLSNLRTTLLGLTQEIDRQVEEQRQQSRELIEAILETKQIEQAVPQALSAIDEIFMQELEKMLKEAREKGDFERSGGLQKIAETIQLASKKPESVAVVEEYLDLADDPSRQSFLEAHPEAVTQEFLDLLSNLTMQVQTSPDKRMVEHVLAANRQALKFSMQQKLKGA